MPRYGLKNVPVSTVLATPDADTISPNGYSAEVSVRLRVNLE
jgi:hypothetical protein